jgi:capsular polysaccharide export protein
LIAERAATLPLDVNARALPGDAGSPPGSATKQRPGAPIRFDQIEQRSGGEGAWLDRQTAAGPADEACAGNRHFLVVLGPFGRFTRRLAASLRAAGARCTRVLLNGGDLLDWGFAHAHVYREGLREWPDWLRRTMLKDCVTDIVLYGDTHPYCAKAARVAESLGVTVHVLEQGYFRPFWITLERNGVNGRSRLPQSPAAYRQAAAEAPGPTAPWLPPLTPPAVRNIAAYHLALCLAAPLFARFRLPYPYSLSRQAVGHVTRYLRQRLFRARDRARLAALLEAPGPLFLVILQRPGDSQLCVHSQFARMDSFIEAVVASFAAHAGPEARLLFKSHPLDHGLEPHRQAVGAAAREAGAANRVFFTEIGDFSSMTPHAAGAVTVNSTAGLVAIEAGLPTLALGKAIYNLPGLTHQGSIDTFWTAAEAPDAGLFDAFRKVVMARTQIAGAYATRRGVDLIVPEATRRLLAS